MKQLNASLLILSALVLHGCAQPDDPHSETCKSIASTLSGISKIDWESPEKSEGEDLRVNLSSPQVTASCFYQKVDHDTDSAVPGQGKYELSPNKMILNGAQVSNTDLIKASVTAMSGDMKKAAIKAAEDAKASAKETMENAKDMAEQAKTGAKKAVENAQRAAEATRDKVKEMMDK